MTFVRPAQAILSGTSPRQYSPLASSTRRHRQALCYDNEGWGPLSPTRFDFTPCFLDVLVVALAAFGIVAGSAAIVYLIRKKRPAPIKKNWHFYTKLVSNG